MISIVIPAHNERSTIYRALAAICGGSNIDDLDIVVVCNGCTDDTAAIARQFGPPVRVVETEVASKPHALNLGDRVARGFPRLYVDADVIITFNGVKALVERLNQGDVLAVAPVAAIDLQNCSSFVRAYYEIRARLPSAQQGIGGSGVYALSELGRRRFDEFPSLTSDDGYVRIQFSPQERATLQHVSSKVFAPRTVKDLVLIRTRLYYGTYELAQRFPELWKNVGERNHVKLIQLGRSPKLWVKILLYGVVNTIARIRARS